MLQFNKNVPIERFIDLFRLVMRINRETKYDCWFDIVGHVSWLEIRLCECESKLFEGFDYNKTVEYDVVDEAELSKKICEVEDDLKEFLERGLQLAKPE